MCCQLTLRIGMVDCTYSVSLLQPSVNFQFDFRYSRRLPSAPLGVHHGHPPILIRSPPPVDTLLMSVWAMYGTHARDVWTSAAHSPCHRDGQVEFALLRYHRLICRHWSFHFHSILNLPCLVITDEAVMVGGDQSDHLRGVRVSSLYCHQIPLLGSTHFLSPILIVRYHWTHDSTPQQRYFLAWNHRDTPLSRYHHHHSQSVNCKQRHWRHLTIRTRILPLGRFNSNH